MLIKNKELQPAFSLSNFEGPLSLLLQLVQKQELEISEISLNDIIIQFLKGWEEKAFFDVDHGAEFISLTASLLVLKSRKLLPDTTQNSEEIIDELDNPRAVLSLLIEYLRFKQMAGTLGEKEQSHKGTYPRGIEKDFEPSKKLMGIEKLSMESLQEMFQEVLKRSDIAKRVIHEETWRVSDKIKYLKELLQKKIPIVFEELLRSTNSRVELIVTFLATLELMKLGELAIIKENKQILLTPNSTTYE